MLLQRSNRDRWRKMLGSADGKAIWERLRRTTNRGFHVAFQYYVATTLTPWGVHQIGLQSFACGSPDLLFAQSGVRMKALRWTKREFSSNPGCNLQYSSVSTPDCRTSRRASPSRPQITEAIGVTILQSNRFVSIFERSRVKRSYWPV